MQSALGITLLLVAMAVAIGGIIYGAHRLTAPAARRALLAAEGAYVAGMAARGRAVALPRTWRSEGLEGHDSRMASDSRLILTRALPLVAVVYVVASLAGDQKAGDLVWQFLIAVGVFVVMLIGLRVYLRRRLLRTLREAAMVPRTRIQHRRERARAVSAGRGWADAVGRVGRLDHHGRRRD
jgi:Kef-type K+ transport system membrane component KefB